MTSFSTDPKEVVKLKRKRNIASDNFKRCTMPPLKQALRLIWKDSSRKLEIAIEKVETRNLLEVATASRRDSEKFWNHVRSSVDKKLLPPISDINGNLHYDDAQRAELFNSAFINVMLPCIGHCAQRPAMLSYSDSDAVWPSITEDEVLQAVNSLDSKKSNGPFKLTVALLHRTADEEVQEALDTNWTESSCLVYPPSSTWVFTLMAD
ncbi:hypothetical protein RvY_12149 [Ramazzottius varieornatus]|uniref:Uncharacterized protein n=1 Tax=Ramazzottius varieornatus TaxID=947166 RepID=A0A1D1VKV4_RAMVA|nr:hypothetical protein RvY_12149 [Ramazzottius varieornatus]